MISTFTFFFCLLQFICAQDIQFPGEELNVEPPSFNLRIASRCPPNMTSVTDEGKDFCECLAGYIYYTPLDGCFLPYRRGPCLSGHYLIIPNNETVAECLDNPCDEGSVIFNGTCNALDKSGEPCSENESLVVNEQNYEIGCQQIITVQYQIIIAPISDCMPGSRKAGRGRCRRIL